MADIFVSYTSSDRDWAHWIALELEKLGHRAHVHEWEIKGGEDVYAWMDRRLDVADRVLCVVSDEYLKAPYATLERDAALWQAAAGRPGFVLLVAVKPCKLPALSDHIRRCELFGIPEDAARLRFRQFIEAPVKPDAVAFPGKAFAVSNIPVRVPEHFLGRDDTLEAIDATLKRAGDRIAIVALDGLPGVGKTTLAAAYAERHRADYRATWWIRAQTDSTMRADLSALGVRLGWVAADEKEGPALDAVRERLRQEGEGLLLIYDNAIDAASLRPYLPPGGASRVLVTSNAHGWRGIAAPVDIDVWQKQVGADYLLVRTGRMHERDEAERLSEALGGLPLAHEQAAAYCERLGISLADYLARFDAAPARLLDAVKDAPAEYHDHLTVAKSFALAIDEAAKLHPAAAPVIVHASLLAPEPLPLFLFSEGREEFGEPLATQLAEDGLDEAVAALRAFALVDRETIADERDHAIGTETIRLHRLVRTVAALRLEGEAREAARRALIKTMVAATPSTVFGDPSQWPRMRRLDALALDLIGSAPPPSGAEMEAGYLLTVLGLYRLGPLAAYAEARPLFERALAIIEAKQGAEHPDTATSLNNLAGLLQTQGDLKGARALFERALMIREKALGAEHPAVAQSLNNLAALLQTQGDLKGARPAFERALTIREKALGPDHPDVATNLNNLGQLLQDQGDPEGARPLFERALAIREKALGPDHLGVAMCLGNLARVLQDLRDPQGARPLFEHALAIRERTLGADHPDTAQSLSDFAGLLYAEGDLNGAGPLYEHALAIDEKALGRDHPNTNRVRSNLARLRLAQGASAEALALSEAALAAHTKVFGADHPWTKESARVSADALDALGRGEEAAALRARYGL